LVLSLLLFDYNLYYVIFNANKGIFINLHLEQANTCEGDTEGRAIIVRGPMNLPPNSLAVGINRKLHAQDFLALVIGV